MKKFLAALLSFTLISSATFAQDGGKDDILKQSMSDILVVGASGAMGAVLGLSTLSFVDEPKDHLKNIVVGGAIGIIIGVGVVAWIQATKSQSVINSRSGYLLGPKEDTKVFTTAQRNRWHQKNHFEINTDLGNSESSSVPGVNFQFSF